MLGILGDSGLLRDEAATADGVARHLLAANEVLRGRPRARLGPGVTARMRERAARLGCFLGFLREAKLEYASVRDEVEARLAATASDGERGATRTATARGRSASSAATLPGLIFSCPADTGARVNPALPSFLGAIGRSLPSVENQPRGRSRSTFEVIETNKMQSLCSNH